MQRKKSVKYDAAEFLESFVDVRTFVAVALGEAKDAKELLNALSTAAKALRRIVKEAK